MDVITEAINRLINKGAKTSHSSYYCNIGWQRLMTEMDYVGQNVTLLKLLDLAALGVCVCVCVCVF